MSGIREPMSETEELFFIEKNDEIYDTYDLQGKRGKWMLFFLKKHMNEAWKKSCELYNAGKLPGIKYIKTSTAAPNPRASSEEKGAIRFTCGPSDDKDLMMKYGQALVDQLSYTSPLGFVAYKTREQTVTGTRATGQRVNHIYKLNVPIVSRMGNYKTAKVNDDGIVLPSSVTYQKFLSETVDDSEQENMGSWKMIIRENDLDDVWTTAVQRFKQKNFNGIRKISINTAMKTGHPTKVVLFYCSPGDRTTIMNNGRNILKYMARYNPTNRITYKVPNAPGYLTYQLENWQADGEDEKEKTDSADINSLSGNFENLKVVNK